MRFILISSLTNPHVGFPSVLKHSIILKVLFLKDASVQQIPLELPFFPFIKLTMTLFLLSSCFAIVLYKRSLFKNIEFRNLLLGIVLILGISASVLIPLLYHSKKFDNTVL